MTLADPDIDVEQIDEPEFGQWCRVCRKATAYTIHLATTVCGHLFVRRATFCPDCGSEDDVDL